MRSVLERRDKNCLKLELKASAHVWEIPAAARKARVLCYQKFAVTSNKIVFKTKVLLERLR